MTTLENVTIDWKALEDEVGLKPKTLAAMAGVTKSMWSQVKHGKRNLSANAAFRLLMSLAKHFNFQNSSQAVEEIEGVLKDYEKVLLEKFPIAS